MPLPEAIAPFALLDSNQAAQIIGTTPDTLVDWRVDRKGPPFLKLTNGMVRYQLRDLLAWMGTKKVTCAG
jgi:predicted DNA-binding transcriptional regulator AlpA